MDQAHRNAETLETALMKEGTDALPAHLKAHLSATAVAAERNVNKLETTRGADLDAVYRQLKEIRSPSTPKPMRMTRIRHIIGQWSAVVSTEAACRKGCSHCCNISVTVPRQEAELMAKATGATMNRSARTYSAMAGDDQRPDFFGVPCTFLKEGACSIYAHRPVACRTLLSMADDDVLCRLVPGVKVPVPYANSMVLQASFVELALDQDWADIRDWFPEQPPG